MRINETRESLTVSVVVESWKNGSTRRNPEYQRGQAWTETQQRLLIDSIFRGYPLPRFYFHVKKARDPIDNEVTALEVIDGQQRILALSAFSSDNWPLFDPKKDKVPLPKAIRALDAPWGGRTYSQLDDHLRHRFLTAELPVVLIEEFDSADEVRDLFIRLQAGTALTRQQVRDAWPGNVGPYVEGLAGKCVALFRLHRCGQAWRTAR